MEGSRGIAASEGGAGGAAAAPAPSARAVAGVVPDGELVILKLRPHPLFIVLSVLGPVTGCAVCSLTLWWLSGRQIRVPWGSVLEFPNLGRLWAAPLVVAGLAIAWQALEWWCRGYLLTDRRVVRVSGVLRQVVIEIPLARVQQVMMYKSLRERVCGLGTPGISSASSGELSFAFWNMVSRPEERMQVIRETIDRYGGCGHGGAGGSGGDGGADGGAGGRS